MIEKINQVLRVPKLVIAAIVLAAVASISSSNIAKADSNSFFNVAKPNIQKVCYTQAGGEGWQALGFINLDHCLRYVSTPVPASKAECNHGYWYVYGFNAWDQCTSWVVGHGGSGYGGDPNEWF